MDHHRTWRRETCWPLLLTTEYVLSKQNIEQTSPCEFCIWIC